MSKEKGLVAKKDLRSKIAKILDEAGVQESHVGILAEAIIEQYSDDRREEVGHLITKITEFSRGWEWDTGYSFRSLRETIEEIKKLIRDAENSLRIAEGQEEIDEFAALKETRAMAQNVVEGKEILARHPLTLQTISRLTCGLLPGYYIIAGEPNVGKSAMIQNIMMYALENPDTVVAYFSFDDSTRITTQRLVSRETYRRVHSGQYPIEQATKIYHTYNPQEDSGKQTILLNAWEKIGSLQITDRLNIYDRNQIRTLDEFDYQVIKLKKKHGKNLIVFADACLKMELPGVSMKQNETEDYRADFLDFTSIKHDIPLITTHELRKRNPQDSRSAPTIEDTKGSGRFGYNAKFGALVYPTSREDWKNGTSSSLTFYCDKNKLMEKTGKVYLTFDRAYNHIQEASQ